MKLYFLLQIIVSIDILKTLLKITQRKRLKWGIIMMNEELIYGEIGRRIREAREENKLTQEDLGKLVNLTRTSITNIERGKQKIPIDSLYYFAKILNVNVFSLLPNEGFLLSNVELPGNEEELQQFTPDVLNFAKKYMLIQRKVRENHECSYR